MAVLGVWPVYATISEGTAHNQICVSHVEKVNFGSDLHGPIGDWRRLAQPQICVAYNKKGLAHFPNPAFRAYLSTHGGPYHVAFTPQKQPRIYPPWTPLRNRSYTHRS